VNADRRLWPGQFVDVVLTLSDRPDSVVVPAAAVQDGQDSRYVFVIGAGDKAEMRPVAIDFVTHAGEAVIARGLAGGEVVVTDGHLRVSPGAKVTIKGSAGEKP
jgi:multidrug efflux system membrane fusion protein